MLTEEEKLQYSEGLEPRALSLFLEQAIDYHNHIQTEGQFIVFSTLDGVMWKHPNEFLDMNATATEIMIAKAQLRIMAERVAHYTQSNKRWRL